MGVGLSATFSPEARNDWRSAATFSVSRLRSSGRAATISSPLADAAAAAEVGLPAPRYQPLARQTRSMNFADPATSPPCPPMALLSVVV